MALNLALPSPVWAGAKAGAIKPRESVGEAFSQVGKRAAEVAADTIEKKAKPQQAKTTNTLHKPANAGANKKPTAPLPKKNEARNFVIGGAAVLDPVTTGTVVTCTKLAQKAYEAVAGIGEKISGLF